MEAAKRGDFSAAYALSFMKHPRAQEALAWAYCRHGDWQLDALRQRWPPVGRPMPTQPFVWYDEALFAFTPRRTWRVQWPIGSLECEDWWSWVPDGLRYTGWSYEHSLWRHRLPEAYIGRARLSEMCGYYAKAVELYGLALELDPANEVAKSEGADVERLATLARGMDALLPDGYDVDRVLTHRTWRAGDAEHYVAVVTWPHQTPAMWSTAPKLVLFADKAGRLTKSAAAPTFSTQELRRVKEACEPYEWWDSASAYVGIVGPGDGSKAELVVIRAYDNRWRAGPAVRDYDVVVYRVLGGKLVRGLACPSAATPWVTDLDGDGSAEVITFREVTMDRLRWRPVPWPIVRARQGEGYEVRSEAFPGVFEVVVPILVACERDSPSDPKIPDHLARAYEITAKKGLAIAAYARAEKKHYATANRMEKKGYARQARLHRESAVAMRQRRLRLEAQSTTAPTG